MNNKPSEVFFAFSLIVPHEFTSSLQQEIEKQNKRFDKLNLGSFACSSEFALR